MYTPVTTFDGKQTGSVQDSSEILHWDGPGWYAGQISDYHGGRIVSLKLEATEDYKAGQEARRRGLGTPRYVAAV